MEIINDENLTKLIEAMVCACQEDEDVTIRQNALQCIYELTNKILDMQVKDKYLNPIVVDINQNCGAYGKGRIYNLEMSVENESNS